MMFKNCFEDRVSCSPSWPQTPYIAKNNLELLLFLSPYPESWDYRLMSSYLVVLKFYGTVSGGIAALWEHIC